MKHDRKTEVEQAQLMQTEAAAASPEGPVKTDASRSAWSSYVASLGTVQMKPSAGSGGAGGMPPDVQSKMETSFDTDFSGVRIHEGEQATSMGAEAFTRGSDIHFAPGRFQPNSQSGQALLGHELTHVVQQRAGRVSAPGQAKSGRVVQNRGLEREADRAGAAAARGERVNVAGAGSSWMPVSSLVQCYRPGAVEGQNMRIADDGQAATDNSQTLYASDANIKFANTALQSVGQHGSFIKLVPAGANTTGKGNKLLSVKPVWVVKAQATGHAGLNKANAPGGKDTEGDKGGPMALWTDCGRSSRAVMGTDTAPQGVYGDSSGKKHKTGASFNPGNWTAPMYLKLITDFMKQGKYQKYLKDGIHYTGDVSKLKTPSAGKEAKKMYWELGAAGRAEFDKMAGTSASANPEIGGGYTMATEYDMPGSAAVPGKMRWNFHWGGVVMKSGADNITLENYAVTAEYAKSKGVDQYDFSDRAWNFAMYGTVKAEQSFHAEHLGTGTHGTRATTFAVESDK